MKVQVILYSEKTIIKNKLSNRYGSATQELKAYLWAYLVRSRVNVYDIVQMNNLFYLSTYLYLNGPTFWVRNPKNQTSTLSRPLGFDKLKSKYLLFYLENP